MSTILDALRRAELERSRQSVAPTALADPRWLAGTGEATRTSAGLSRSRLWKVAGLACLLLAAGSIWLLLQAPSMPLGGSAVVETRPAAPEPPNVRVEVATRLRLPEAASAASMPFPAVQASAASRTAVPRAASAAPTSEAVSEEPVPWGQLTAGARDRLAALAIGGAVHSADRLQRFVLVGGEIVREGSELAPGIVLERIEPRALWLRVEGKRVLRPL